MNTIINNMGLAATLILAAILTVAFAVAMFVTNKKSIANKTAMFLANVAEGIHEDAMTFYADAAIATRFLVMKAGSDADHAVAAGAADLPIGICTDEATDAEDPIAIALFSASSKTRKVVASEAITKGSPIYTAASGKVQNEPAIAGTYYRIGRARAAAAADGDVVEIETHLPVKVVILAALTSPDTADGSDAATTQALANAIKDDIQALEAALTSPAELMVLA